MSGTNYTQTTNYGFYKPIPNADVDAWGDHWNSNADNLDSIIHGIDTRPAGGVQSWNTRTGAVTLQQSDVTAVGFSTTAQANTLYYPLSGNPSNYITQSTADGRYYAATNPSGYVNASAAASAAPVQSVSGRVGAVSLTHSDITDWASSLAPYAPLASPVFTGAPSLPTGAIGVTQTAGTNNTTLATTAFVTAAIGPGGYAPLASPVFTGDPQAPTPGIADNDQSIATTAFVQNVVAPVAANVTAALHDVGRNYVQNPVFTIAQRGTGPWTTDATYTLDRWRLGVVNDTVSVTSQPLADADRSAIGDEYATSALQAVFTGSATAGSVSQVGQRIEALRRLSGKSVVISFWAKATAGTPKLGIHASQNFGTGGSPSVTVGVPIGSTPALSTAWTRYSFSVAMPSTAGKVFGANIDSFTNLVFDFSDQANSTGTGIGVQSGTVQLWGVQLEIAQPGQTQPTPLDRGGTPQQQLAECQRFYLSTGCFFYATSTAGSGIGYSLNFPTTMRAVPTIAFGTINYTNAASLSTPGIAADRVLLQAVVTTGSAAAGFAGPFTASADL